MSHVNAKYKSFKATISVVDKETVMNEKFWPTGVQCMMWRDSRNNYENNENENNNENNYDYEHRHNRYDNIQYQY